MESRKIVVISLDHWNYDEHIIAALQKKGIESRHINFGNYKHPRFWDRINNSFSKIVFKKNLKKIKRQEYILEILDKIGKQDQILVINPDLIDKNFHLEIKKRCTKYIAYLYDSVARHPVEHLLDGVFDTIFSFDNADVKKYHFKKTTNYIYLEKQPFNFIKNPEYQAFYIATFDNRYQLLGKIAEKLNAIGVSFLFIIVKKRKFIEKVRSFLQIEKKSNLILFKKKRIEQENIGDYYNKTNVILDLVRDNQIGLSFRIFEAMAYQKKIITSNASIVNYDFYNPNNILVVEESNLAINKDFFTTPYEPIPATIYNKYTLENWVNEVFELKK